MTTKKYKLLNIDGTTYLTRHNAKFENRPKWEKDNPKMVKNSLPGTVLDIFVEKGDPVAEGQLLLTLEAMKMINNITAPFQGTIKKIYVKQGQALAKDSVIIEME